MHTTLLRRRDAFARSAGTISENRKAVQRPDAQEYPPHDRLFSTQPITLLRLSMDTERWSPSTKYRFSGT